MEQQYKSLTYLMEFPFFAAEVESHRHAFFQGLIEWGAGGNDFPCPEGSDAHRCGVPGEAVGVAKHGVRQRFLQQRT